MKLFAQITKVNAETGEVHGRITQEAPDSSGEVMDYESSKPNFEDWSKQASDATGGLSKGNVRAMHGKVAAGKLTDISFLDEAKAIDVVAKIVDQGERQKCIEGVYTGFSIGGKYAKRWQDGDLWRYTAQPSEVSLVDNPCLKSARFTLVKADGTEEERELGKVAAREDVKPADGDLKKYLGEEAWDVSQALSALNTIYYLYSKEQQEDHPEAAAQTADLQEVINRLKSFIASEIQETDTDESMQMADGVTNFLAKVGARNSKGDADKIQTIHDHAAALGADCKGAAKSEVSEMQKEDVEKLLDERLGKIEEAHKAEMEKIETANTEAMTKKDEEITAMKAEIDTIKANTPKPGGPILRVVTKAQELGEVETKVEPVKKEDGTIDRDATALALTKAAMENPVRIGRP